MKNTLKDKEVQVREGSAGVTRLVTTLNPGASTTIRSDPNATYKEYIMMTLPDNTTLPVLSSDDFADFKEIDIVEEAAGNVVWKGTTSRSTSTSEAPVSSPQPGFIRRLLNRMGF